MTRLSLITAGLLVSIATFASAEGTFPTVTSEDLNGRTLTLPQDLPGNPTIVFIAYKQAQQDTVDAWVRSLGLDASRGAEFLEVPVVGRGARLMRSVIDNGMRSGITDTAMRARTVTLYESVSKINDPLGFSGRGEARVLVVARSGEVLYSTSGGPTSAGVQAVQAAYQR